MATRWVVTHDIARWKDEIAWMSLYFSAAVWASLLLASFGFIRQVLPRYRRSWPAPAGRYRGRFLLPCALLSGFLETTRNCLSQQRTKTNC